MPPAVLAFWAALSFLTRLVPPPPALDARTLHRSVPWHPFVGALAGALACLPLWLGLGQGHALIQGWLYVLCLLWLTRALHWDGLADVADACGSGQHGAGFHRVLKDSRLGAFGAMALVMGAGGQVLAAGAACAEANWWVLLLAPLLGRCLPLTLAVLCPAHADSFLGRMVSEAVSTRMGVLCALCAGTLIFLCFRPIAACILTLVLLGIVLWLARIARREGGLNGDFFGAAIVLGETAVLLTPLC